MSRIAFNGNALGTGTVTIASPNTNSDRTVTLPDATGTLITNSGTEAISAASLTVSGASTTGSLTVNSNNISAVNSLGFRNRLINGGMVIDQRNAGASVTPANGAYTLDRWAANQFASASKFSVQQSSVAPAGFTNSLLVTSLSAYSIAVGDLYSVYQSIEGFNVADLGWGAAGAQTVTLSFWVRSSLTGTFGGAFQNDAGDRAYPFTYTISVANTWEQKTVTVAGDTTGTWLKTNGAGITIKFGLGVGSNRSSTAGAWAAGNFASATGATSIVGTSGATFYITGVQLEAGSVATPFERVEYGTMLRACQRYFESSMTVAPADNMSIAQTGVYAMSTGGATALITYSFKITKRSEPTVTYYAPLTTSPSGKVREDATGTIRTVAATSTTTWGAIIQITSGATTASYQLGYHASSEL